MILIKRPILTASIALNLLLLLLLIYLMQKMGYLGRVFIVTVNQNFDLPTDTLSDQPQWQETVDYQQAVVDRQHVRVCLFGDSISSGIENTLGNDTFNFAIPGMSTISQLEQLRRLSASKLQCDRAIVAIGTNDAAYRTNPNQFEQNLTQIVRQLRQSFGVQHIVLLPAFYSTVAASRDPSLAGTLDRVQAVNDRIEAVGRSENLPVLRAATAPLFAGFALRDDVTIDGVHLNGRGKQLYRAELLKIVNSYRSAK